MILIELLKAILLGLIEGFTEWLPISSTGHMILADQFLQLDVSERFKEFFLVIIQLAAILAVVILFFKRLDPIFHKQSKKQRKRTWMLWAKVLLACIPAGVLGVLFDDWIDANFFNPTVVALMLILYGVMFLVMEFFQSVTEPKTTSVDKISFPLAFGIGISQVLSLIPGTSRSGATILGGMLLGASRPVAAEFSFFLAIPVMAGASLLKVVKLGFVYSLNEYLILAVGCVCAFTLSWFSIRFLMDYVKKHSFAVFGIYRIVLGVIILAYFALA
ncbi:MAG: undecaprenyl-diphosphate phosphatase [Erysipelotrichaceae bacterium]|jgi:undecaprenyl-diphosphatase|nr:undecaprenyl-diphosphate phosphatase [Erysipelotrichaceae bacterium]